MILDAVYYDKGTETYLGEISDNIEEIQQLAKYLETYYGGKIGYHINDHKVVFYNYTKAKQAEEKVKRWLNEIRKTVRKIV